MTNNIEKKDLMQMIKHIDGMTNSNHERVKQIDKEVNSYDINSFNPEEVQWLSTNECKSWIYGQLGENSYGQFGWMPEYGIGLQNIGEGRLKCISMFDDPPAIYNLAWLRFAVESVGGQLALGEFTVLRMPPSKRKQFDDGFFPKINSNNNNATIRRETSVEVI